MPRRNSLFGSRHDPETRFDHWLDGFVTGTPVGDSSRIDDPTGQLARAQSGARQLHDLAARPVTMPGILPARQRIEERMMHSGTLSAPGTGNIGTSWKSPRRHHEDKVAWWSLKSPVIAAALIFAVLISLSGALYWAQRPDTSPDPAESPSFAKSSPGTTPEGGSLSCGAPGYRPVVWDGVDPNTLIAIGEAQEPIVRDGTILSIPIADTGEIVSIEDTYLIWGWDDGVVFATESDDDETILATSLTTGHQWTFPVIDSMGTTSHSVTVVGNYLIGVERSDGTNYRVINLATGEERTVADIRGEGFDHLMIPYVDSHNSTVAGSGSAALLFRSFSPSDFEILFLPNDLGEARLVSTTDGMRFIEPSSVAVREHRVAFLGIDEDGNVVLRIEDGATGELVLYRVLPTDSTKISAADVRLLSDGVIIVNERHVLRVPLDTNQEVELIYESNGDTAIKNPEFAPDGSAVIIALQPPDATPSVRRASIWLDTTTGETIDITTEGYRVSRGDWSAISNETGASLIDLSTGEVIAQVAGDYRQGVHLDERGIAIAAAADNSHVAVLSGSTGQVFLINAPSTQSEINLYPQLIDISPSGSCLLLNDTEHGNSYIAPLEPDGEWTQLDVQLTGWWEVPTGTVQTLPAQDFASPVANPTTSALSRIIPGNVVPVIESEPWPLLDRNEAGGLGESGLTIPLRNGETYHDPDGVGISQILHTGIAIVEHADGSRISLDLETGETLSTLYPDSPNEQLFGFFQFTPVDGDMTNWRILDVRSGDEVTTNDLFGGTFDTAAIPTLTAVDLEHPATMLVRFPTPEAAAGSLQPVATASGNSSTVIIPGNLEAARATDLNYGRPFGEPQTVAVMADGESPLLAYVTDVPSEVIHIDNAATDERIQTFSASDIGADGQVFIAGFIDDGNELLAWSGSTVSLLDIADGTAATFTVGAGTIEQVLPGASSALVMTNPSAGTPEATGERAWHHLDLVSGKWTDLPELSGYHIDRTLPASPWVVLRSGGGPTDTSIVIVDKRTGEIAARLDDPDLGTATSLSPSHDFSTIVITGHTGDEATTGYVLDAERGEAWEITPPDFDLSQSANIWYTVSPDGSLLVATNFNSPTASEGDPGETWISPVQPEPEWSSVGNRTIETWLYDPDGTP